MNNFRVNPYLIHMTVTKRWGYYDLNSWVYPANYELLIRMGYDEQKLTAQDIK
ncbi:MAG: hypothetical protein PSV35_04345 [bacterium]|nr:hypothetical protein [bacterium]